MGALHPHSFSEGESIIKGTSKLKLQSGVASSDCLLCGFAVSHTSPFSGNNIGRLSNGRGRRGQNKTFIPMY